ncbi:MAG: hypothetical protein JEZ03_12660 [Bacteroidales bacterium]|nr:hypothetical protein [Bacteroidales bacterium]
MILKRIERYILVGTLLHSIALFSFLLSIFISRYIILSFQSSSYFLMLFFCWFTAFIFSISVLAELDVRSRYQNYKQLKDQFYENGFQSRIVKPMIKSRCQRDAALLAASELGYKDKLRGYFYQQGYRWYHVLPDFVFDYPKFILSPYFWMTTFFVKKYNSKYFEY